MSAVENGGDSKSNELPPIKVPNGVCSAEPSPLLVS